MSIDKPGKSKKGGLGEKIENVLIRFITIAYENTIGAISSRIRAGIDHILEDIEDAALEIIKPFAQEVLGYPELPSWVRTPLEKVAYPEHPISAVVVVGAAIAILQMAFNLVGGAISQKVVQIVNKVVRPNLPDINLAAGLTHRNLISNDQFFEIGKRLGYKDEIIYQLLPFSKPLVSAGEFIKHAWLAGLGPGDITVYLGALGYTGAEVTIMINLYQLRPGPSDLVRFGVREVWRDDVASKWGYDIDFPAQFGSEMKRAGDQEGWAKSFWRAHWELPSLNMTLEMLHRGVITAQEFDEYLRIADYPAGWRTKIKGVAFSPYTRVDTRRMYRYGVLDEMGVFNTYKDIGYDDDHATRMTEFTVLDALVEERELTKTDVLKSYRLGRFDSATAKEHLMALGFNAVVADILLANQDQALEDERINNLVKNTHSIYVRGGLTASEVLIRLSGYNLGSAEIERYLELWGLERQSRVALPSRTSLDGFLKDDIITVAQYKEGLVRISYQSDSIEWYTQAILLAKQARAEKEHDRAVDEQEKLLKRGLYTDYQKEKALLTVELREIETSIGEWQNAIQARGLQFRDDQELAKKRLTVEGLYTVFEKDRRALQYQIDYRLVNNTEFVLAINQLQTAIGRIRLSVELAIDESLLSEAKLSIAQLQAQKEVIQSIIVEARREIIQLESDIVSNVDKTFSTIIQQDIAVLHEEIEVLQDHVAIFKVNQAEIKRQIVDADYDTVRVLEGQYLDINISIAEDQESIDHLQTLISGFRLKNVQPELAEGLNTRQDLIAQIKIELSEADILLQEIDQQTAFIRVNQIQPSAVKKVEAFRTEVLVLQIEIEQVQDNISANNILIAEYRAQLSGVRAQYKQSLVDLQRVVSSSVVIASYNRDLATLQAGLSVARNRKNELRVELARLKYQFIE